MEDEKYVEDPKACPRCKARGKTWPGSNPKCAFREGVFTTENWNCATMSDLRTLAHNLAVEAPNRMPRGFTYREDMAAASIGVVVIPENDTVAGYLCMTWYKSRGRTGRAYVLADADEARALTLKEAEAILGAYKK
jgi:hypothetical protein